EANLDWSPRRPVDKGGVALCDHHFVDRCGGSEDPRGSIERGQLVGVGRELFEHGALTIQLLGEEGASYLRPDVVAERECLCPAQSRVAVAWNRSGDHLTVLVDLRKRDPEV